MPSPPPPESELTISRINRFLRPLRAKCTTLSTFTPSIPKPPFQQKLTTYSSRRAPFAVQINNAPKPNLEDPPLCVIPPPRSLGSRVHIDKHGIWNLELSQRIYSVTECFKSLLHTLYDVDDDDEEDGEVKTNPSHDGETGDGRTPSLRGLCCVVIGRHMHLESLHDSDESNESDEDEDRDTVPHDEENEILNELYESILPQYRRPTLVSHALSLILSSCPHHPTLLQVLLDLSLVYAPQIKAHVNLRPEMEVILRALLLKALGGNEPPICHPGHTTWLTELSSRCSGSGVSIGGSVQGGSEGINRRSFIRILVDVLASPSSSQAIGDEAWSSKSLSNFSKQLKMTDFPSFLQLIRGLSQVGVSGTGLRTQSNSRGSPPASLSSALATRLSSWIHEIVAYLTSTTNPNLEEDFDDVVELLADIRALNIHILSPSSDSGTLGCIRDSMICLATFCLASPSYSRPGRSIPTILAFLRESTAQLESSSLDHLIDYMVPSPLATSPSDLADASSVALSILDQYANKLRSHELVGLEVCLWGSALRWLDGSASTSSELPSRHHGSQPSGGSWSASPFSTSVAHWLRTLRDKVTGGEAVRMILVEKVEGAEGRQFGGLLPSGLYPCDSRGSTDGQWEWEEMVGCWVRKTPGDDSDVEERNLGRGSKRQRLRSNIGDPGHGQTVRRVHPASKAQIVIGSTKQKARKPLSRSSQSGSFSSASGSQPSSRFKFIFSPTNPSSSVSPLVSPTNPSSPPPPFSNLDDEDEENGSRSPTRTLKRRRTMTNFTTILQDVAHNRVELHPKTIYLRAASVVYGAGHGDNDPSCRLSSDDVLDLFAYDTEPSSPGR
ncbi:hypothetical protein JAAARDRAFT_207193 [Jaapia argillacea MUCL 33604]|uniref:Uncharacterized protein n=1 Tax=Jaapia argillacea MUCL 33604 TaxID=933084 RepID=A0A067PV20_9AGAM|nr:hypothetical protein JAAARDRAFT_207193 [Jaapia argillacea MUCL 33604]